YDRDEQTWIERADACVDAKKSRLTWLDLDDDGVVDDGETAGAGATLGDFTRTLWTHDTANFVASEWTTALGTRRAVDGDR
ncbi:MAG: hypothetical protein KC583_00770, partial [Myxococcales bacterium]|nr:hypothetical protein [Myxococcales bacterium]